MLPNVFYKKEQSHNFQNNGRKNKFKEDHDDLVQSIWIGTSKYALIKRGLSESPTRGQNKVVKPQCKNDAIELELIVFKKEIEDKFAKSKMNQQFRFPRIPESPLILPISPSPQTSDSVASIPKIYHSPYRQREFSSNKTFGQNQTNINILQAGGGMGGYSNTLNNLNNIQGQGSGIQLLPVHQQTITSGVQNQKLILANSNQVLNMGSDKILQRPQSVTRNLKKTQSVGKITINRDLNADQSLGRGTQKQIYNIGENIPLISKDNNTQLQKIDKKEFKKANQALDQQDTQLINNNYQSKSTSKYQNQQRISQDSLPQYQLYDDSDSSKNAKNIRDPKMLNSTNNILFQQYKETTMQRDKSNSEITKVKRQQFKSLILQQKDKKNNIGQIIGTLLKQQSNKNLKTRNQGHEGIGGQGEILAMNNGLTDSNLLSSQETQSKGSSEQNQIKMQKSLNTQKSQMTLTPIKIQNQKFIKANEQTLQKIQLIIKNEKKIPLKQPSQSQLQQQSIQEFHPAALQLAQQRSEPKNDAQVYSSTTRKNQNRQTASHERVNGLSPNITSSINFNNYESRNLANFTLYTQGGINNQNPIQTNLQRPPSQENGRVTNIQIQASLNLIMNDNGLILEAKFLIQQAIWQSQYHYKQQQPQFESSIKKYDIFWNPLTLIFTVYNPRIKAVIILNYQTSEIAVQYKFRNHFEHIGTPKTFCKFKQQKHSWIPKPSSSIHNNGFKLAKLVPISEWKNSEKDFVQICNQSKKNEYPKESFQLEQHTVNTVNESTQIWEYIIIKPKQLQF
eukprot:403339933